MTTSELKVSVLIATVGLLAGACLLLSSGSAMAFPGMWALGSFTLVAYLLDRKGNDLRFEAKGSTSFVVHMAAGILFGPFWGAVVAGTSTFLSEIGEGKAAKRVFFNCSQRVVAVAGGLLVIGALGAPDPLFDFRGSFGPGAFQERVAYFVLFSAFYFGFNSVAVSLAVAGSSGRTLAEVWNLTFRGVLGYDLAASALAVVLAWLYSWFDSSINFGAAGFIFTILPILVIRHIYGLYRRLQSSGRELLDLMVKAIEARDPYTSGHSVRVATLAKAIAQEAKMSTEEVEQVYTAAVLHDVGKIHEEFAPLLRKESKLTPEETALLQTHSVKSAELVGIISSFRGAVQNAVRSHHERWDGGGYPDGLAGEVIPLGARIIMISDTTDAMTTDRPYRGRMPIEAVIAELQKHRGTQFDPKLVDLVINSVTIRRTIAEMQNVTGQIADGASEGGSKRVQPRAASLLRGRGNWPRIRAF